MIIAADIPVIKKAIKIVHHGYTDRYAEVGTGAKTFDSKRIIDTIRFPANMESIPPQMADICAFIIKC
jgi:hypothetical protein